MSESIPEILENQLKLYLGEAVPTHAVSDIHAALELSEILEAKGFSFQLKDLCPKSPNETQWRGIFIKDGEKFSADDPQSSVAVCKAAVDALASQWVNGLPE
ncbi:hypothetical protein [Desulfobacula sp.]|uniref:hypothetical protein n=1 Tax=Desulfobacula sp. TaxID=2593537 RepID=UPI002602CC32|nr:hypothetical protein [Desulfobacula sp.]